MRRLTISQPTRDRLQKVLGWVLVAVIVICVVIVLVHLAKQGRLPSPNPDRPTTHFSTTAPTLSGPNTPYYRNCAEARADGRSNIPSTDPAYRPDLDHNGDGIACEG